MAQQKKCWYVSHRVSNVHCVGETLFCRSRKFAEVSFCFHGIADTLQTLVSMLKNCSGDLECWRTLQKNDCFYAVSCLSAPDISTLSPPWLCVPLSILRSVCLSYLYLLFLLALSLTCPFSLPFFSFLSKSMWYWKEDVINRNARVAVFYAVMHTEEEWGLPQVYSRKQKL